MCMIIYLRICNTTIKPLYDMGNKKRVVSI